MTIKQIYKSKHFPVILLIIIGILSYSFLLYYGNGLIRENFANIIYYKFINSFPEGLTVRTEPMLIAILWFFKRITRLEISQLIMISRNIILAFQIIFFYKIAYFFCKQKNISFVFTLIFIFAFSTLAIADNLLRNNLGNLFYLIVIYYSILLINRKNKKQKTKILMIIAGLFLGVLTYTHLLPNIIIASSMILCIGIYFLASFFGKKTGRFFIVTLKNFTAVLAIGVLVSLSYILSLIRAKSGIGDYQESLASSNAIQPVINLASSIFIKILRFVFEYRDVSLPIILMLAVFAGVIYLFIKKKRSIATIFVMSLWIITYLGTKLDFIGIGVLSYRFSLMMIIPSLLILLLILKDYFKSINSDFRKAVLLVLIPAIFLAHNIPKILDTSVLRNYNSIYQEKDQLASDAMSKDFVIAKNKKMLLLGTQGLMVFPNAEYVFNSSIFQEKDPEKAYNQLKKSKINYVLFDTNLEKSKSQDIGKEIDYNFDKFFNIRYFDKIVESESDFSHSYIFKVNGIPSGLNSYDFGRDKTTLNTDSKSEIDNQISILKQQDQIQKWAIDIETGENENQISETITFKNHQLIIKYLPNIAKQAIKTKNGIFKNQIEVNPIKLDSRNGEIINYNFSISSGQAYLNSTTKLSNSQLKEMSYDKLNLLFKTDKKTISLSYLNRQQFAFLINILVAILAGSIILLLYLFKYRGLKSRDKKSKNIKNSNLIYSFAIALMTLNLLFEPYFVELYKRILGM